MIDNEFLKVYLLLTTAYLAKLKPFGKECKKTAKIAATVASFTLKYFILLNYIYIYIYIIEKMKF